MSKNYDTQNDALNNSAQLCEGIRYRTMPYIQEGLVEILARLGVSFDGGAKNPFLPDLPVLFEVRLRRGGDSPALGDTSISQSPLRFGIATCIFSPSLIL
mmetsp:Transcript_44409/g.53702  ORF Transcript_44409/g.53702 Transcript_44409/m.53702 type:complete len:100 (+) Transcript_44409:261-560(+)